MTLRKICRAMPMNFRFLTMKIVHWHTMIVQRIILVWSFAIIFVAGDHEDAKCERLQTSLTYSQEDAPRDLSAVLPLVVERVNRVLDGVVDVEVEWTGANLHGTVGEHVIQTKVTRLADSVAGDATSNAAGDHGGRQLMTQCFHVPFTIYDTNECTLPKGHSMRHRCHASALCVNTNGSYECICPRLRGGGGNGSIPDMADDAFWAQIQHDESQRSAWEISLNVSSCPLRASTHGCCPILAHVPDDAPNRSCRAQFKCPVDPCSSHHHDCAPEAKCQRAASPREQPDHVCPCPTGRLGSGHRCRPHDAKPEPKVMYDGVTPTDETLRRNYCGCTRPTVDACSGFPPCTGKHEICQVGSDQKPQCACKQGYVKHAKYGCVDERPPIMKLAHDPHGDSTLRLKQGDVYHEHAVDIDDDNAEEFLRSLKIAYSRALPHGCLTQTGTFTVNYTIAMPWTTPDAVHVTRKVVVEDVNECAMADQFAQTCPALVPQCDVDAGAKCVNTNGGYRCECPRHTTGDGFKRGAVLDSPVPGFKGGTGCRDTSKPMITLAGPNPKVFRVCPCVGVHGVMDSASASDDDRQEGQQSHGYGNDIKRLIQATNGAELCATPAAPSRMARDCANAIDETFRGPVDLAAKVVIGEPVQKSSFHWSVPYDVTDEAGNAADTVWRDVIVEEIELSTIEAKVRQEVLAEARSDMDQEIRKAVDKAVLAERRRAASEASPEGTSRQRRHGNANKSCPPCPICNCNVGLDPATCDTICEEREQTCAIHQYSVIIRMMLWLEARVPPTVVPAILGCGACFVVLLLVRWTVSFLFSSQAYQGEYDRIERERLMQQSITYYDANSREPQSNSNFENGDRTMISGGKLTSPPTFLRPLNGNPSPAQGNGVTGVDSIYESPSLTYQSPLSGDARRRLSYQR